ncbi:type VI secretion system tube protein Hcp [bacterium]|nr:type VI secretion system tube protein Hcp [bacterium]
MPARTKKKKKITPNWTLEIADMQTYAKDVKNLPKKIEILSISSDISLCNKNMEFSDIHLVLYYDVLTPFLFKAALEKKILSKVIINLEKGGKLIIYELSDSTITSIRPGGSAYSSDATLMQEISFSFKKIKQRYKDNKTESVVELVNEQIKNE